MSDEHLAKEAERLLGDEVLADAIIRVGNGALKALAFVDADDKTQILRLQSKVQVCNEILDELAAMVIREKSKNSGLPDGTVA